MANEETTDLQANESSGEPYGDLGLDPIVSQAKRRFHRVQNYESYTRNLFLDDSKFANADADNGYQWPNDIRRNRDVDERPTLTVNIVRQHCLQIINDAKQNKPAVTVHPTGNGATYESAQALSSIVKHIEYISNAQVAYDTATRFQVQAGIGYWRVVTDYAGDDTMDQEIFIRRIQDPLTVYLDPDIREFDGSDAAWGFIFDNLSKEDYKEKYPKFAKFGAQAALGNEDNWVDKDHIRVAEYYRKTKKTDKVLSIMQNGKRVYTRASKVPKEALKALIDDPQTLSRSVEEEQVEWFLIIGHEIAERKLWSGKYIPIVRLIGEETIIDGRVDRVGHVRAMKDPQRIYNYWTSSAVEQVALQGKTPIAAPMESIEEFEEYYKTANRINHAYLPFKATDENGNPLPPPQRIQPAVMADAYIKGMQISRTELMYVSGQYQSVMGEQTYERSGKAIQERQRQGENSTYHFIDNLGVAIRYTGKILLDLIPKIYDTNRIMRILADDGTDIEIELDPAAKMAYFQERNHEGEVIKRILNPNIGKYEVQADIGPAYSTKREEAFNAMTLILTQAPNLVGVIGDLLFKAGDFPFANEAAQRIKRMIPKQALGQGPTQNEQVLQQQVQNLSGILQKALDENARMQLKIRGKEEKSDIAVYDSETKRMAALQKLLGEDPDGLGEVIKQLVQDALATHLQTVSQANADKLSGMAGQGTLPLEEPPLPGAQKAPDGKWYIADKTRPGKFLYLTTGQ